MKLCDYCGSNIQVRNYKNTGVYVCSKHYMQLERAGQIKRTKYDANIFKISYKHNIVLMKIYDINGNYKSKTIFNLSHLEQIQKYKWCLGDKKNIITRVNGKNIKLHRLIMNAKNGDIIRHKNKNLLNNLDSNLEIIISKVTEIIL